MGRVTIRDVADRAGVATSTVSRALTKPGRINPETTARVLRAAQELGYVVTRSLRPARKGVIALLVPDVTNPFYFDIIRGTQRQLQDAGYLQLLIDTGESAETEQLQIERLKSMVDGIILTATRLAPAALSALASEIPLSAINRVSDEVPGVVLDTRQGLQQALDHLRSLGHSRVAFVAGPTASWQNQWRWREFDSLAASREMTATLLGPYPPRLPFGAVAADALLATDATACIAFNDLLAIGILQRLAQRGVDVPADLSVVGCDDIFGADFCTPPLTTISGDAEHAGRIATSKLLARIAGDTLAPQTVTSLPTHLLVRGSTAPVRAAT